jgi:hypothetical protein
MDVEVVAIVAAIVGAIATIAVAWIGRERTNVAVATAAPEPTTSMNGATAASSTALAAQLSPNGFVNVCRALLWVLVGLSFFLGFSGLTGASFSIGIFAVRAFASHAISLQDSFVMQFAVLSAFGFFCASVWRTLLGLLSEAE